MNNALPALRREMQLMKAGAALVLGVVCLGMVIALLLVSRAIVPYRLDERATYWNEGSPAVDQPDRNRHNIG